MTLDVQRLESASTLGVLALGAHQSHRSDMLHITSPASKMDCAAPRCSTASCCGSSSTCSAEAAGQCHLRSAPSFRLAPLPLPTAPHPTPAAYAHQTMACTAAAAAAAAALGSGSSSAPWPRGTCCGKPRVLVVDDVALNRLVLSRMLTKLGFEVLEACDGQECLAICHRLHATLDCVLLDLNMPVLDGWSTAVQVREWERGCLMPRGLPLLACTNECLSARSVETGTTVAEQAFLCGMNECICKPPKLADLRDVLAKYVPSLDADSSAGGQPALQPADAAALLWPSTAARGCAAPPCTDSMAAAEAPAGAENAAQVQQQATHVRCAPEHCASARAGSGWLAPSGAPLLRVASQARVDSEAYGLFTLVRVRGARRSSSGSLVVPVGFRHHAPADAMECCKALQALPLMHSPRQSS